jgi:hypothetical protein
VCDCSFPGGQVNCDWKAGSHLGSIDFLSENALLSLVGGDRSLDQIENES